jgi:hypothetical protein
MGKRREVGGNGNLQGTEGGCNKEMERTVQSEKDDKNLETADISLYNEWNWRGNKERRKKRTGKRGWRMVEGKRTGK